MPKTPAQLVAEAIEPNLRLALAFAANAPEQDVEEMTPTLIYNITVDAVAILTAVGVLNQRREFRCRLDDNGVTWVGGDDTMRDHARNCSGGIHDERTAAGAWVMVDWDRVG